MNNHLKLGRALPTDPVGDALADCYLFLLHQIEPPSAKKTITTHDVIMTPTQDDPTKVMEQSLQAVNL